MAEPRYRPEIFDVSDLKAAMRIILTPEDGHSPEDRWRNETPPLADLIAETFKPEPDQTVIDFGAGVGRVAKELMARRPCNVIGVDISRSMRALSHMYCENDAFFSLAPAALDALTAKGPAADFAYSVWVLQHVEDPAAELDLIHRALRPGGRFLILNLRHRCVPTEQGWRDDGIDLRALLAERFELAEDIEPPEGAVTDAARPVTFCAVYRKAR